MGVKNDIQAAAYNDARILKGRGWRTSVYKGIICPPPPPGKTDVVNIYDRDVTKGKIQVRPRRWLAKSDPHGWNRVTGPSSEMLLGFQIRVSKEWCVGHNLPSLVGIGLTELPNSVRVFWFFRTPPTHCHDSFYLVKTIKVQQKLPLIVANQGIAGSSFPLLLNPSNT